MNSHSVTRYIIVDTFPSPDNPRHQTVAGATVGIWVCKDNVRSVGVDMQDVRRSLDKESWEIARIVGNEVVTAETYENNKDGFAFFEQAQEDGLVANFHLRAREWICLEDDFVESAELDSLFEETVLCAAEHGVVGLYSEEERQWANGVSPDGDEFVPVWCDDAKIVPWLPSWEGYRRDRVQGAGLTGFLEQVNESDMWVGLGVRESALITCHPIEIAHRVQRK